MSSLHEYSARHSPVKRNLIKGLARSAVLSMQNSFRLFPQKICLISGAPRSGTSALCEWLGHQQELSAFTESRILVSMHAFIEEIHRFRNLDRDEITIADLARQLVYDYYASSRILIGKRMLVDKEPLEPIAFPSKEYGRFLLNMRQLFPESKFLLAIRHPIATVWSMSQRTWGESLMDTERRGFTLQEYIDNWCSCADLILQYSSDPNTYIVQFGRLVNDPESESRRIFDFLDIRGGVPFQPRQTHEIGFSTDQRQKISLLVQSRVQSLDSAGISELS